MTSLVGKTIKTVVQTDKPGEGHTALQFTDGAALYLYLRAGSYEITPALKRTPPPAPPPVKKA